MFGFSVFLGKPLSETFEDQMDRRLKAGFDSVFTSLHIPEDDSSVYLERLKRLGDWTSKHNLSLYADISGEALEKMGLSFSDPEGLRNTGLTGLRMDYGIPMDRIASLSNMFAVALNASTLTEEDLEELSRQGACMENFVAWHNYYPRPETGLSKAAFAEKNRWLKEKGLKVASFVPGDEECRGPLYAGLPTLEKHRYQNPFAGALESLRDCWVDEVFIGDPSLSMETFEQFRLFNETGRLLLLAELYQTSVRIEGVHTNRPDPARDVFRSSEGRLENTGTIKPERTDARPVGSITVDNDLYGRYSGEVQITYKDLPSDDKINVVGRIRKEDVAVLLQSRAGEKIEIRNQQKEENSSG